VNSLSAENDNNRADALLDDLVDLERGRDAAIHYMPSRKSCELCKRSLAGRKYMIDGAANDWDSWACMCATCFLAYGKGIAYGSGQLYIRDAHGWLQVGGFAPEES